MRKPGKDIRTTGQITPTLDPTVAIVNGPVNALPPLVVKALFPVNHCMRQSKS